MSTSEDIRIQAQLISSLQIDKTTCLKWIQEQIMNIASDYYKAGKYTKEYITTSEEYEDVELPEIIMLDKIIDSKRQLVAEYELHNNTITLKKPDTYEIRYYAYPPKPDTVNDMIDIPTPYVSSLKFYIAARIRARLFGQGDSNAISFYEEYSKAIQAAEISLNKRNSRHRRMPPSRIGV